MQNTVTSGNRASLAYTVVSWGWFIFCGALLLIHLPDSISESLDSDMSSLMVIAKELADTNQWLLTTTMYYSTEAAPLDVVTIYALIFHFTDDWFLVRYIGTIITDILYCLSIFFLATQLKVKRYFPIIGGILLLPISADYYVHLLFADYYTFPACYVLLSVGLLIMGSRSEKRLIAVLSFLAAAVIAFVSCTGGLRMVFFMYLPALVSSAVLFWFAYRGKLGSISFDMVSRVGKLSNGFKNTFKLFKTCAPVRLIVFTLGLFIFACIGYLINVKFICPIYGVSAYGYSTVSWTSFDPERAVKFINGFLVQFGYTGSGELFKPSLLLGNISAFVLIIITIVTMIKTITAFRKTDGVMFWLGVFFAVSIFFNFLLASFTTITYRPRHALLYLILAPFMAAVLLKHMKGGKVKICIGVISCLCCLALSYNACYRYLLNPMPKSEIREAAQVVQDAGYTQGYANFWAGNVITEYSNGTLETWVFGDLEGNVSQRFKWLQAKDHMDSAPEGKFFLALRMKSPATEYFQDLPEDNILYKGKDYAVYGFNDMSELPEKYR